MAGEVELMGEYKRHDIRVTSLCVEGQVIVVSHSDVGQGGGLHMLQLEYIVDGDLVPMKCDMTDIAASSSQSKRKNEGVHTEKEWS